MLTSAEIEQYERDGWLAARHVVVGALLAELRRRVDAIVADAVRAGRRPEKLDMPHLQDSWWLEIARAPAMVTKACQLLGTDDVVLFASHLLCKPGGDGLPVPLHQDASYWPLTPMAAVSAWVAVDPADDENGCVRFMPGSQKWGSLEHEPNPGDDATKVLHLRIPQSRRGQRGFVSAVLEPGDVSFHHPFTLHYSRANRSARRRAGLTLRYVPRHVKIGNGWPYQPPVTEVR